MSPEVGSGHAEKDMSRNHIPLNPRRWSAVRRTAFERDGYRCQTCGKAGRLEAYHEPPLRDGADPYDIDGIRTLCRACHIERHRPDGETPGRAAWRELVEEITSDVPPV